MALFVSKTSKKPVSKFRLPKTERNQHIVRQYKEGDTLACFHFAQYIPNSYARFILMQILLAHFNITNHNGIFGTLNQVIQIITQVGLNKRDIS